MPRQYIVDEEEVAGFNEPIPRRHSLVAVTVDGIYIYGGLLMNVAREHLNPAKAWHYNLLTKKWRLLKVQIDPNIMWSSGFAPTSHNGCTANVTRSSPQSAAIPLFFFCERRESASIIDFFIVYLEDKIITCRRLNIIDLDGSFVGDSAHLPFTRSDFIGDVRVWFRAETDAKIVVVWNSYQSILIGTLREHAYFNKKHILEHIEKEEIFKIFELKKMPKNSDTNTADDNSNNFNLTWSWRKLMPNNEDNTLPNNVMKAVASSMKPIVFLWINGTISKKLCFISRSEHDQNALSYIVQFDLGTCIFTWHSLYNYIDNTPSSSSSSFCNENTKFLPYTIFDNIFVLLEFCPNADKENEELEDGTAAASASANSPAAGLLNIWMLDLKTKYWQKWLRHLENGGNNSKKSGLFESSAQFDATGATIYIFGGVYYSPEDGEDHCSNEMTRICLQPNSLQHLAEG